MNNDGPPFFRGRGGPDGMLVQHHGGTGGLGWVIFALQLLMLAALAVLLVRAFTWRPAFRRRAATTATAADPADHLRWRYARGEITREEYLQASRDLGDEPEASTEELPAS